MSERIIRTNPKEDERYTHIGVISCGLVACDVYSEFGDSEAEWLTQLSGRQSLMQVDPFRFESGIQVDANNPHTSLILTKSGKTKLDLDSSLGLLIEGPLDGRNFQERIPHLVYAMTERIRQQEFGIVTVHAAAASKDGQGLLIMGDKGAGKTSLLLSLCLEHGYKVVGNDLVLLQNRESLTLVAGSHAIDVRDCVKKRFERLKSLDSYNRSNLGPYEIKTRVYPQEVGMEIETSAVPVSRVFRVDAHDLNTQTVCTAEIPIVTELLRLNENLSRYIRGATTPVEIKEGRIKGYYPSFDTEELGTMRNDMINKLIGKTPYYYISGNNPSDLAVYIDSL